MADSSNIPALAKPAQQCSRSEPSTTIARCDRLTPATLKQGTAELGACLTLVSPSGLTAEDRKEWLAVAMKTLSGIPADLLADGCAEARKRCRFPSEIVPTIIAEVETRWKWRREDAARAVASEVFEPKFLPKPIGESNLVDPADVARLLKSLPRA